MEYLPKIADKVRLPLKIRISPYLLDHQFEGKAVLPGVEALQILAASTSEYVPDIKIDSLLDVKFEKFLHINPHVAQIDAFNELEVHEDGSIVSKLITKTRSKAGSITLTKEHVSIRFPKDPQEPAPPLFDEISALEGFGIDIPSDRLYGELVPFGPAYHNVKETLTVSEQGAIASVYAPDNGASSTPLGSPFPLDAALHAACAWGQRYKGIVGFPVGFGIRHIFQQTSPGATYIARIIPKKRDSKTLIFDIWIYDQDGVFYETALDVLMGDVSGGRMKPPQWVREGAEYQPLSSLKEHCEALAIIELKTINKTAVKALSDFEHDRYDRLGNKRKKSYLGSRLCCKTLSRKLSGDDKETPASSITTISPDQIRPRSPLTDGRDMFSCSVSHDNRYAVAVAAKIKVGVDVEEISEKVLRSRRLYMKEREEILARNSPLGEIEASVRIWSIKEAISKALGITLAQAWEKAEITDVGQEKSLVFMEEREYTAIHDTLDNHVFTMVS
ncbi:MAG: polyketide synthase dehydratase domain-containing protein [Deltaproteobacteria bacterium]|nr:polyketide synthase dehydratase domain-containing protein [Deltaproteobacteria bacterium]